MKYIKKYIHVIVLTLFALSIALLINNRFFVHSDYQSYYRIDISEIENKEEIYNLLNKVNGLIEIDRFNHSVYFQNVDFENLNSSIEEINVQNEGLDLNIVKITPSTGRASVVADLVLGLIILVLFFVGFVFVFKTRFYKWSLKQYAFYNGFFIGSSIVSVTLLLGLISTLSYIYKVNSFVLISVFILILFKTLTMWFKLTSENLDEARKYFLSSIKSDNIKIVFVSLILIIFLGVSMGVKSVLPLLLIIIAIVISLLTDYVLLTVKLKQSKALNNANLPIKQENSVTDKKYIPNPKFKKKNKPKK